MPIKNTTEMEKLEPGETLHLDEDVCNLRINVEWTTKVYGIICDLDLMIYTYDDRLISDVDLGNVSHVFMEAVKLDVGSSESNTEAILLVLSGGSRNYQHVQSITMNIFHIPSEKPTDNLASALNSKQVKPLCNISAKPKKDYQTVALGVVYKDGWYDEKKPRWVIKAFMEPMVLSASNDAEVKRLHMVVNAVPSLYKYRPRVFNSVRDICTAMSSVSLPSLKKKFLKSPSGLPIVPFTEVLFRQLYEYNPKVIEEDESSYLIVLIQEMFHQIDYNGDKFVDWDEFTSFIIQNSLIDNNSSKYQFLVPASSMTVVSSVPDSNDKGESNGNEDNLDQYVVNYGEDLLERDHVLSSHRHNVVMKFIPENRRILVVPEDSDHILILNENFHIHSTLYPHKIQTQGSSLPMSLASEDLMDDYLINKKHSSTLSVLSHSQRNLNGGKFSIYDVIYLANRDMFAFSSSDHSIIICKEQTSVGGHQTNFFYHDKIYHRSIHLKLCWSNKNSLLCSVASDHTIYGWDIDKGSHIFQISRHSDIITDFICVDEHDSFITCSMDKRIVMWSATTKRVRGVYLGHQRGIRSLSVYKNIMLSSGFECEARTWDLNTKDAVAVLVGHRHPIRASKLMCDHAQSEKDYRAITVDDSGEFRLWNIYVKERSADPVPAETLQVFLMINPENPINQFKYLAIPYNPKFTTGFYSDIIACSTKLIRFLPEKLSKEFIPPSYSVYNDTTATLYTCAGLNVHKYDLSNGKFLCQFQNIHSSEISVALLDGVQGRRLFLGCTNGDLLLVNSVTGAIIDKCVIHSKEVTGMIAAAGGLKEGQRKEIYTCSMDGRIRSIEEVGGKLHMHNTVEIAFGDDVGVTSIKSAPSIHAIIATSSSHLWGIWNDISFKKMMVVHEESVVMGAEVISASRDPSDLEYVRSLDLKPSERQSRNRENLLTLAIALPEYIQLYTIDVVDIRGIASRRYYYYTEMAALNAFQNMSFNDYLRDNVSGVSSVMNSLPSSPAPKLSSPKFEREEKNDEEELSSMIYITDIRLCHFPSGESVNNSKMMKTDTRLKGPCLVVTSDDGQIFYWVVGNVRHESEDLFRKRFSGVSIKRPKRRKTVNKSDDFFSPRADELNLSVNIDSRVSSPRTNLSSPLPLLSNENTLDIKASRIERRRKHVQLQLQLQLKKALNQEDIDDSSSVGEDQQYHMQVEEEIATNDSDKPEEAGNDSGSVHSHDTRRRSSVHVNQEMSSQAAEHGPGTVTIHPIGMEVGGEYDSKIFNVLRKVDRLSNVYIHCVFQGHKDAITNIIPLLEHGCIGTISFDGYHRVWNSDRDCLGELLLPNVTEKMKKKRNELKVLQSEIIVNKSHYYDSDSPLVEQQIKPWRFAAEKLQITDSHKKQAKLLRDSILNNKSPSKLQAIKNKSSMIAVMAVAMMSPSSSQGYRSSSPNKGNLRRENSSYTFGNSFKLNKPGSFISPNKNTNEEETVLYNRQNSALNMSACNLMSLQKGYPDDVSLNSSMASKVPTISPTGLIDVKTGADRDLSKQDSFRHRVLKSLHEPIQTEIEESFMSSKGLSQSIRRSEIKQSEDMTDSLQRTGKSLLDTKSLSNSFHGRPLSSNASYHDLNRNINSLDAMTNASHSVISDLDSHVDNGSLSRRDTNASLNSLINRYDISTPDLSQREMMTASQIWTSMDNVFNGKAHVAPAFSEQSLLQGMKEGMLDGEEYRLLRKIGCKKEKAAVYDRMQPTLMLRSSAMSVHFVLPPKNNTNLAEVEFGSQKDLYKNAINILNSKVHISKTKIRNAVALKRIDASVSQVRTMLHELPPLVHEEVIVPNTLHLSDEERKTYEEAYTTNIENQRMKRRLQQSALLVPFEASFQSRALDLPSIHEKLSKLEKYESEEKRLEDRLVRQSQLPYNVKDFSLSPSNQRANTASTVNSSNYGNRNSSYIVTNRRQSVTKAQQMQLLKLKKTRQGYDLHNRQYDKAGNIFDVTIEEIEKKLIQAIKDEYKNRALISTGKVSSRIQIQAKLESNDSNLSSRSNIPSRPSTTNQIISNLNKKSEQNLNLKATKKINSNNNNSHNTKLKSLKNVSKDGNLNKKQSKENFSELSKFIENAKAIPSTDLMDHKPFNSLNTIADDDQGRQTSEKANQTVHIVTKIDVVDDNFDILKDTTTVKPSKVLNTRFLLPYYKIDDVRKFVDVFTKYDEDFSGDLDVKEWVKFFSSINRNLSAQDSRMVFMKVDKNGDGQVSLNELVPIVFGKATKEQSRAIIDYVESEVIRKHTGSVTLSVDEIEQLFESYDEECIGFISALTLKEKIQSFNLPEAAMFMVLDLIKDVNDDEMINLLEFLRILKPFTTKER